MQDLMMWQQQINRNFLFLEHILEILGWLNLRNRILTYKV